MSAPVQYCPAMGVSRSTSPYRKELCTTRLVLYRSRRFAIAINASRNAPSWAHPFKVMFLHKALDPVRISQLGADAVTLGGFCP